MKKIILVALRVRRSGVVCLLAVLLFAQAAHAGGFDKVKGWMTLEVAALALSAVLTVMGGALGIVFRRISLTFKEAGEFMTELGTALEDSRLTREELSAIIREGRDIFAVWK